jgi:glycosyltransferase involved in cell wall biosynthesis
VRIALVHDWVTGLRGGERVLDTLARNYPDADLFTLFYQAGSTTEAIDALRVRASFLNNAPGARRHYRKLLPLYPLAMRQLRAEGYDLVLSINHSVSKSISIEEGVPHLCYCLTPMRYIWDQIDAYLGRGPRRALAAPLVAALRRHDLAHSGPERVDRFLGISSAVADRIRRHYGRSAPILHPPVDVERIRPDGREADDFYLLIGGFVPYKREEIAIEAFRHRAERLVVAGDGPTRQRLEARAPANVEFTGRIPDDELRVHLQRCRALIHPQDEDFGIAAVEVQAAGRPVIALGRGGALDTVRPLALIHANGQIDWREEARPTGLHFSEQSPESLAAALDAFAAHAHRFDSEVIRAHAEGFSEERFLDEITGEIDALVNRRAKPPRKIETGAPSP